MTRAAPAPRFVAPELATLVDRAPVGPEWVFEVKYDGYRLEAIVHGGRARVLTRRGNDWTARFPRLAAQLARIDARSAILDGEVVVLDAAGRSRFSLLQQSLDAVRDQDLTYFAFDLLQLDGKDLRALPLSERRDRLVTLLRRSRATTRGPVRLGQRLIGDGASLLRAACRHGLEGIIAKRSDGPYVSRRDRSWVKVKCGHRQEFVVVGFTPPQGSRVGIGALLLAVHDRGTLRYAGRVGTGFSDEVLRRLLARLERIERRTTALAEPPTVPRTTRWVRPSLVVEVSFTEWTTDGSLRHPVFQGIREDKPAASVRREEPR